MVTTNKQAPTASKVIEILSQTIGNPVEMKSSDFMMGLVCDQNGNVQESVKKMVIGGNYYFLAYDESTADSSQGLPDYSKLPQYIVSFELIKFKDKNVDTFFTWVRAGLNAVSTIMDAGVYAQDQSEGQVKGSVKYNKKDLTNPEMYLASYIKDGQTAFVMTVSEK
jgi:hypothetical protein